MPAQGDTKLIQTNGGCATADGRTGDPFKDFELDLRRVDSEEARAYIQRGRESTYRLIDLLYRTDWQYEKKVEGVKLYSLKPMDEPRSYLRLETKFANISVSELVEYFTSIDKRMAWEGNMFESIEQLRAYPMSTTIFYGKLAQKWHSGAKDCLMLAHGVSIKGDRYYLSSMSVEHADFPPQKKVARISLAV